MMRANPFVCFEVEQIDDLANWRSVIARGVFEELAGKDDQRALQLLVNRLMPLLPSARPRQARPRLRNRAAAQSRAPSTGSGGGTSASTLSHMSGATLAVIGRWSRSLEGAGDGRGRIRGRR